MKSADNKKRRIATGQSTYMKIITNNNTTSDIIYYDIIIVEPTKNYTIGTNATITSNGKGITLHYIDHFQKTRNVYLSASEWEIEL